MYVYADLNLMQVRKIFNSENFPIYSIVLPVYFKEAIAL